MTDPVSDGDAPSRARTGLTPFLVRDPSDPGPSIEALREALESLARERDYLREVRDVQLAEHQAQLARMKDRLDAVERQLEAAEEKRDHHREKCLTLEKEVEGQRAQAVHFLNELTEQRRKTAALLEEVAALRDRPRS